jgi:SHAQKYF class myb-like DNA-binding protein
LFAGSYGHSVEPRRDGEGREGDRRGRGFSDFAAEGRGDARVDLRREVREAEEPEVGLGLGIGTGGSAGSSERGGLAEKQGHGGHPMPTLFRAGSDPTGYNPGEGRSEQSSAGLPFMMNGLPYGAFDRRLESSSYSGRGDDRGGGSAKNARKLADSDFEDTDSAGGPVNSNEEPNARTLKRPRLVWTPQLHKRFVDAVGHLGIKNAVPKTIMQLMNVEGLTRENVASHLQKYRLYLKRLQGMSSDGPPASADQLFASTPLPPNLGLHYMAGQREDVVGPQSFPSAAVAMPFQGLGGRVPFGPAHFSAYEPTPYGGMNRGFMQRPPMKDRTEHISESENHNHGNHHGPNHHSSSQHQPSSPPKRLLSLFPTTSD